MRMADMSFSCGRSSGAAAPVPRTSTPRATTARSRIPIFCAHCLITSSGVIVHSSGAKRPPPGSDAYASVWDGKKLHGMNASGRSPALWTPEYFGGATAMPVRGWNSVSVPGAISAWVELHAKFGKLPFERLFEPAIRYGREGFLVSPTIAGQWAAQAKELHVQPGFAEAFMPGGRPPAVGEMFRFPG